MVERIRFEVTSRSPVEAPADLLVLPVFEGPEPGPGVAETGRALGVDLVRMLQENVFKGTIGEALQLPVGRSGRMLLFLGVGPRADVGTATVRVAAMRAGATGRSHRIVASTLPQLGRSPGDSARAFAEGYLLGRYRFDRFRTGPSAERAKAGLVRAVVTARAAGAAGEGTTHGEVTGLATNWARDLVNTPAGDATPQILADEARRMARRTGLDCRIWTKRELERGGFGGVLGVGSGSVHEPRLVELTYPSGSGRPIAITGKGVTFDSGGLTLKRSDEIGFMKSDMAGAAAAFAAMRAVAELGLHVNVIAAVPLAENLPGAAAIRPGDVVRHRGCITSEVLDTDAEGRVLLADALAYLAEKEPALILDSATLTDAGGLGSDLWAVMGTDRRLVADLLAAGSEAGEPGWELPLWAPYRKLIDSALADVKNLGDHGIDSSIMAGLFLRDFVGDVPWLHLDTGSSAWAEHETDLWPKGATGSPTRAIVRFIERRAARRAG